MLSRSNRVILILATLAAVLGGYLQHELRKPGAIDTVQIDRALTALRLPDLDGRTHALSEYRGRRVLLNFWASWCAPCREELPLLSRMQAKFGNNEPIVVGIAMDEPIRVRSFLAAQPLNFPILIGSLGSPSTSLQAGDAHEVLPYSVLIGADGHTIATHQGALPEALLAAWLSTGAGSSSTGH
jgi:thiol-disulfide isomerase/thioredoxin